MADRYWVGGTADWDATAGTKWAATSGGAGGEPVPTASDDVFFDANSTGTCTIVGNQFIKSLDCTGFTGTLAQLGTFLVLNLYGNFTLSSGMTYTLGTFPRLSFRANATIITAGKTVPGINVLDNATLDFGSAVTTTVDFFLITHGTVNTNGYALTGPSSVQPSGTDPAQTKTFNLNNSTVSVLLGVGGPNSPSVTFNAGTSQINLTGPDNSSPPSINNFSGNVTTYYNVSFTSANLGTVGTTRSIGNNCNFNNLTLNASATGVVDLAIGGDITVSGTFTCAGSSATQRGMVRSDTIGTSRTITVATLSATDCDFRDITIAGGAAGTSPTRAGNCGNNSGITFPAAKTVYWNLAGTQNWNATGWATTNNGSPAVDNFPLAQDTAAFTDSGSAGTVNFGSVAYNFPTIDASARTSAMTLGHDGSQSLYGSYILGSGVTVSGTASQTFLGTTTQTITSAGKTLTFPIVIGVAGRTSTSVALGDAFNSSNNIILTTGTFNASNYNLTCTTFASSNANTRTITMGSGSWTLSGTGTVWNLATTTALTFNKDSAEILLSNTSSTARTFAGGGLTYNKFIIGGATGTSTLTFTGSNTFSEIASIKTVAHTLSFTAGTTTTVGAWTATGTSGNVVTIQSATAASHTLTKTGGGVVSTNYMSISRSTATPSNTWYAGDNSTDGGNNSGWLFTAAPIPPGDMFFMFN